MITANPAAKLFEALDLLVTRRPEQIAEGRRILAEHFPNLQIPDDPKIFDRLYLAVWRAALAKREHNHFSAGFGI